MGDVRVEPQPGPQTALLSSPADIVIYGGGAGGGKTFGLLLEPLRHVHNPEFGAVVFRRTTPQITNEGGLWDEAGNLYPLLGARPYSSHPLHYTFPSGAKVSFTHMQYETNKHDWQGSQIPLILWDELTHFTEGQFWYMLSRNRSTCGVRPYQRASCNPDAASWVARLIAWWIDPATGYPVPERAGVPRYFLRVSGVVQWADTAAELEEAYPEVVEQAARAGAEAVKSLTFIPSSVYDNPALLAADPGYLANLLALPPVDQERLLRGNWKIQAGGGTMFDRDWFVGPERSLVEPEAVPRGGVECRFWDFAASEYDVVQTDKPFTAGWKMVKHEHANGVTYYVTDVVARQLGPAKVDDLFFETTRMDAAEARFKGRRYLSRWEFEGGSSGKKEAHRLITALDGLDAAPWGVSGKGDKYVRAKPLAVQAKAGNIRFVRAPWNEEVLQHLHQQPEWPTKDIMDAGSGCHDVLTRESAGEAGGFYVPPKR